MCVCVWYLQATGGGDCSIRVFTLKLPHQHNSKLIYVTCFYNIFNCIHITILKSQVRISVTLYIGYQTSIFKALLHALKKRTEDLGMLQAPIYP